VHYAPHGVSYELFSQALRPDMVVPPDLAALPEPRIGFYGNVYPWIDFDLVERLARARPPWHFVLIGGIFCDVGRLQALPNVHFLGRREHGALPAYCKGFSAAMIPYDLRDPRMESVNPVKTRELLAAGVPVVAADVPELRGMEPDVLLARDVGQWLAGLERQMARADRPAISARMAGADWSAKVAWLRSVVDRAGLRQAPAWVADTATGA
jgi:hypothetical protein